MNTLENRFGFSPFSVLRTMNKNWLDRKRHWVSLGLKGEVGREGTTAHSFNTKEWAADKGKTGAKHNTSLFDPFLCELVYRWFTPHKNSLIIDPFAGGPPRGIVAGTMGHRYIGTDLNKTQIQANYDNLEEYMYDIKGVSWHNMNGLHLDTLYTLADEKADLVFTCPPYGDLELYTDDPDDISNMDYDSFMGTLLGILLRAFNCLNDNRFMVVVVSDFRNPKTGLYRGFPAELTYKLKDMNVQLYNEFILVNSEGTLPFRVTKQFQQNRKAGKMHQNVLVFIKGDPRLLHEDFEMLGDDEEPMSEKAEWI